MSAFALQTRYDRAIFALALPALGALAADPLVSLVDTAFVGQLGEVPLAALGVNASVFSLAFVAFNFLAYGTTPRVGRAVGEGDRAAAGRVVVQALTLAVGAGLGALLILQLFARPILSVMGASGVLMEPALTYLRIRALAGPAVLIVMAGHGAFRGYQDTRTPLVVSLGLNAVNLVFDPLFIFGFGWGLAGAAWATMIAQWTGALWFLWLLLHARREQLGVSLELPRLSALKPFLRIGWELAMRTLALTGTMGLATAVAARVSVRAVAAHQVAAQLWLFLALVVDALAIAAQALVARYLGEDELSAARAAANRLLVLGLGTGAVLGLGFAALRPVLPGLFTSDPEIVQVVSSFPICGGHATAQRPCLRVGRGLYGGRGFCLSCQSHAGVSLGSRGHHASHPADGLGPDGRLVGHHGTHGHARTDAGGALLPPGRPDAWCDLSAVYVC